MQNFLAVLDQIVGKVDEIAWGPITIILLLGTGLYYSIILKGLQFRGFRHAVELITGKYDDPDHPGEVSHFQALSAALSATIGTGNIAGVATAIAAGGPGAVFWMWMVAVVGMLLKYASSVLAHKYRVINEDGVVSGGPMYYLEKGLKQKWLGVLFALFTVIASFGIGNMVQANSVAEPLADLFVDKVQGSYLIREKDITDWNAFMTELKEQDKPGEIRIWNLMDDETRAAIVRWEPGKSIEPQTKTKIISAMNRMIKNREFYSSKEFTDVTLGKEISQMLIENACRIEEKEIQDWPAFMACLKKAENPAMERVCLFLDIPAKRIVKAWEPGKSLDDKSKETVLNALNKTMGNKVFYQERIFSGINLAKEGEEILKKAPKDMERVDIIHLNRLTLEAVYPALLTPAVKSAGKILPGEVEKFNRELIQAVHPRITARGKARANAKLIVGLILAVLTAAVIIGGIKRIGKFAEKVVPFMCIVYVLGSLIILIRNFFGLGDSLSLIFSYAFTPAAAVGGFAGAVVAQTIRFGVARGLFSSESGLGSAPIAHSAAKTDEPVREGLVAMLGPFIDTIVICTMTALVILSTGAWNNGQTSSPLTVTAYNQGLPGLGGYIVTFGLVFFAFSTLVSWSYYGDRGAEYLLGQKAVSAYRWIYVALIPVGAALQVKLVWGISDIFNALMAFPNLIGLLGLSGIVVAATKDYFARKPEMDELIKMKQSS